MSPNLFEIDTVIITPHTVTRRFREGEGAAIYDLLDNNRSRLEGLFAPSLWPVYNVEESEMLVRKKLADWLLQKSFAFGVWHFQTAKAVGFVELFDFAPEVPRASLHFFIDRDYEGKGIMTEVLREVIQFGFRQLELQRIDLYTASDNFAAQRLARKTGFTRDGDLRGYFRKPGGELMDVVLLSINK
jgi:RimJ/RimL family protein N-acetyltransferase